MEREQIPDPPAVDRGDIPEIIILSLAKGWGGAEEYLELLKNDLSRRGIGHRIVVREGAEYAKRGKERGDVVEIPYNVSGLMRFARESIPRDRGNVIHVNRYYDIFRGWYVKKRVPNSILILYQHCYLNHPNRIPLSLTDGIICISEFVKTSFTKKFPSVEDKIAVINSAIDLDLFQGKKSNYGLDGPAKIGMVGRFDKNQEELLTIGGTLKRRGVDVTLHFAGEGKAEEEALLRRIAAEAGLSDKVIFHGTIPHSKMANFYSEMDIVVSTMRKEGLSLAAMESMACGLPFVAYNASGFRELIDNGKNGILVDGDTDKFSSAIELLIRSEERRKKVGTNAAEKARAAFGIETNVLHYLDFIRNLLRKETVIT